MMVSWVQGEAASLARKWGDVGALLFLHRYVYAWHVRGVLTWQARKNEESALSVQLPLLCPVRTIRGSKMAASFKRQKHKF